MLDAWRGMRYTAKVYINECELHSMTWIKVYYYPIMYDGVLDLAPLPFYQSP